MAKIRDNVDILEMFESQFTRSEDKFATVKKNWKEDNNFSLGEQWDKATQSNRQIQGKERPCLVINKIDPMVHRIVNTAKQQKLTVEVKPMDDGGDPDTALILGGMIRNFEYVSNAVRTYMWAFECAVRAGLGYFKLINEYEDENSFDQIVKFKRIKNPLCVSFDPDAETNNGSDSNYSIISEEISKFTADSLCKEVDYDTDKIIPTKDIWNIADGTIRHGEINWKEFEEDILYQLKDFSTVLKSEIAKEAIDQLKATPGAILKERKVQKPIWWYANLVGGKVIEKVKLNTKWNPIIRVIGREGYIDGKVDYRGITRNSMDSNRMYNVMSSLLVERIGLAPRASWVAAAGQIEGYEQQWLNSNNENIAVLEYNPVTLGGNIAPSPQKSDTTSGDPTIERYMQISSMDIKDTSDLGDAFMGQRSNETSGAAIKARSSQSDMAVFDLIDNLSDSIEHGNRVAIDMAQRSMSNRQIIRIMGEDYTEKVINLNAFQDDKGNTKKIDLTIGNYDAKLTVSSGDKTRRETAIEQLSFVLQTNPEAASLIMDIFVGNLDIKDAKKVANRFKAMLPPKVIAAEEQNEKDNPELDAFEEHATQIITQLKAQLEECIAKLKDSELKLKQKDGELAIKNREVDIKEQEFKLKELETLNIINNPKESESKTENKKENGKEETDDSAQLQYTIRKMQTVEEELAHLHKELDIITTVLEKLSNNGIEQQEPTQPDDSSTQGTGLPPAEVDNNVGAI